MYWTFLRPNVQCAASRDILLSFRTSAPRYSFSSGLPNLASLPGLSGLSTSLALGDLDDDDDEDDEEDVTSKVDPSKRTSSLFASTTTAPASSTTTTTTGAKFASPRAGYGTPGSQPKSEFCA